MSSTLLWVVILTATLLALSACAMDGSPHGASSSNVEPPERIQAWMDRLTVPNRYDPETGFIVAEAVTELASVYVVGDKIEAAAESAIREGVPLVVFATADRSAPCQQFKLDAMADGRVLALLREGGVVAIHVEVDRQPEIARRLVGSLAIPMTYSVGVAGVESAMRGPRSAEDLLAFLKDLRSG